MGQRRAQGGMCWECGPCHGRTSTIAQLRKAVAGEIVTDLWKQAWEGEDNTSVRCPACANPMRTAMMPLGRDTQELDICVRCHLVWFDPLEYDDLLAHAQPARAAPKKDTPPRLTPEQALVQTKFQLEHAHAVSGQREWVGAGPGTEPPDAWWKYLPALFGMPVEFDSEPIVHRPWATWIRIPAAVAFVFWVGLQVWGASRGAGNVAYGAHLGGALMGVGAWFLYRNE